MSTDSTRDENASLANLPFFAAASTTNQRGRTYSGKETKEAKSRRLPHSRSSGKKKSRKQGLVSGDKSKIRGSKRISSSSSSSSSSTGTRTTSRGGSHVRGTSKPVKAPRCALQTLGGSGPLKGGLPKALSNKATLKKMKGYGGKMFFDKCYLSDDDDDILLGSGEEETLPWVLSPSDVGGAEDEGTRYAYGSKETRKRTRETPSFQKNPLLLSSSPRNHGRSSSSSGSNSSSSRSSKGDPFSLGRLFAAAEEEQDDDTDSSEDGDGDGGDSDGGHRSPGRGAWRTSTAATEGKKRKSESAPRLPRARKSLAPAVVVPAVSLAAAKTNQGTKSRARSTTAADSLIPTKMKKTAATSSADGAGGGGITTSRRATSVSAPRGKRGTAGSKTI